MLKFEEDEMHFKHYRLGVMLTLVEIMPLIKLKNVSVIKHATVVLDS